MLWQKLIGGSGDPPAVSTYRTYVSNGNNATTYTFTNASIGTASADRYVLVAFGGSDATPNVTDSTVTIGGVSATKLVGAYYVGTATRMSAMYIALVPTGTTATIVVTFSEEMSRIGLSVFSITRLQSTTPRDSVAFQGSNANNLWSSSLTGPDGGFIIGNVFLQEDAAAFTWTGIVERNDEELDVAAKVSSASDNFTSGGAKSVSVRTTDDGGNWASCAVYMR